MHRNEMKGMNNSERSTRGMACMGNKLKNSRSKKAT
jgi:hypothetical protein